MLTLTNHRLPLAGHTGIMPEFMSQTSAFSNKAAAILTFVNGPDAVENLLSAIIISAPQQRQALKHNQPLPSLA